MPNLQKWVNLSFVTCGILTWILLREVFSFVFDSLGWARVLWIVPPPDVGGILVGLVVFIVLLRSLKANEFLSAALVELSKVTWPKRKETAISTGVVAIMVAIATLCVLFFDSVWRWITETWLY